MTARRTFLVIALCAALDPAGVWAQRKAEPLAGTLVVAGSSTLQPVVAELAKLFQARHSAVRIEVRGGGSGRGMSDALAGKADIGMVSRPLKPEEKTVQSFAIGRDGCALIAHRDNPVSALTRAQMRDILTGRIASWKAVGGRDEPIELLSRSATRGCTELMVEYLGTEHGAIRARREMGDADNMEVIGAVAQSPAAMSWVSLGEGERRAQAGTRIRLLAVDGIAASARNVRSGDFPVSRPLMLVTRETPRGPARAFIEFALSPQAAPILVKHDFVPYAD